MGKRAGKISFSWLHDIKHLPELCSVYLDVLVINTWLLPQNTESNLNTIKPKNVLRFLKHEQNIYNSRALFQSFRLNSNDINTTG